MLKTNIKKMIFGIFAFAATASMAQTIGDIAEMQRGKLIAEINAVNQANAIVVAPTIDKGPKKPPPEKPIRLHSIYKVANQVKAEVTDGINLAYIDEGMVIGKYMVFSIKETGVELVSVPSCKKSCPKAKVVAVGGLL